MRFSLHSSASFFVTVVAASCFATLAIAQPTEDDYYPMYTVPTPEGVLLEVGGIATLPEGRLAVSTRRGEVWIIGNPADLATGSPPAFKRFAEGLHEPLGLLFHQKAFYTAQRGELTKLVDTDGDEIADIYETVASWPLSSHYHEYTFGPKLAPDGSFFVTTNVAFGDEEWWRGESRVPWRGWTLKIHPDGTIEPWATGMRSPAGLGMFEGEFFYTENQGDWVGSGGIWHVTKGAFSAHPAGLRWAEHADSPMGLTEDEFSGQIDHRRYKENGRFVKPENVANEEDPMTPSQLHDLFPETRLPAVVLPHGILGVSNSEILVDQSGGAFGPFSGQLFVGDQGQSKIMRVAMEKVDGAYQGVAFDFRAGFQSGVMRLAQGQGGIVYVGETNRGWGSAGEADSGLQFLTWSGKIPFEMQTVKAMPDGFEIVFTKPVEREAALDLASYSGRSYTYKYHPVYGSPQVDIQDLEIEGVALSDDGRTARLAIANLRPEYVHELHGFGLREAATGYPLLHPSAYYTLNAIPGGKKMDRAKASTRRSAAPVPTPTTTAANGQKSIDFASVQPLLTRHTCTACHSPDKRLVGPSFSAIADRNYSPEEIVQLIYSPQPENWPGFPTPMAPMTHVPEADALQIARWINSLANSPSKAPSP